MLSVLDLFRIGIGPSSSHTVGPIRIAGRFLSELQQLGVLARVERIEVELQGSLALTGAGHASPKAVMLGLLGLDPETLDPEDADNRVAALEATGQLPLPDGRVIPFAPSTDLRFSYDIMPVLHPNGMRLRAFDSAGESLADSTWYSTGGGFIASQRQLERPLAADIVPVGQSVPHPFYSAAELLGVCQANNMSIDAVILGNEGAKRSDGDTGAALDRIADVMMACIDRGLVRTGILPGGLKVRRRAPELWQKLQNAPPSNEREQLFDWLNVYAMAVNEENAAGGQVVTAPTNGAAGIIPSIIRHYCWTAEDKTVRTRKFLLTAGGIGLLYKQRASISGAEMGCQGEVGVACSMAAAGLAAVWGGTPQQIANAAEIAMEHNLGLTCDPVGGLVQIPCIERNAIGAVKAANAARLALHSHEQTKVSLDQVIETMRQTGIDMSSKYKETSQGGLAVNVVEC
ncbi:MAG: L-serine ammonia-lyase [Hyphomonas sp.]|uniref:L-serine ammonia-lyase n=1 Tax=Hyphomonas sp. TaxID=87 RepID=UPI0017B122F9|nr:L-serine ammonia-lyase [Hyphomonas sp.]MBA3069764.1 L-serine ammonia-lyase [Hyphomonas sp.]MBU3919467.1 L-serine ammonia-lyase [Alphaproteobacteria bacterium]MBU4062605.1 L-serine ammonia-lyase [Alphaproteobacteria bacterium]MBU4163956.1 L-serine ammonia-lyase [Alphaproteobacteria bacterium]